MTRGARTWILTWFLDGDGGKEITPDDLMALLKALPRVNFIEFQKEQGGTTGRLHYQVYLQLRAPIDGIEIKTRCAFPGLHFTRVLKDNAFNYCHKEETRVEGPWSWGERLEKGQGRREDLEEFREDVVVKRMKNYHLFEKHLGTMARYPKLADKLRAAREPPQELSERKEDGSTEVEVTVLYGDAGMGKSRGARQKWPGLMSVEWCKDALQPNSVEGWEPLLLEEFHGDMPIQTWLKFVDRYPAPLNNKGGTTVVTSTCIVMTTNKKITEWWPVAMPNQKEATWRAVLRRITRVYEVTAEGEWLDVTQEWKALPKPEHSATAEGFVRRD